MNFLRTMSGAIGVAIVTTFWYDGAQSKRAVLAGTLNAAQPTIDRLAAHGLTIEQARDALSLLVDRESVALATGQTFAIAAGLFAASALIIWLAPRPTRVVDTSAAH